MDKVYVLQPGPGGHARQPDEVLADKAYSSRGDPRPLRGPWEPGDHPAQGGPVGRPEEAWRPRRSSLVDLDAYRNATSSERAVNNLRSFARWSSCTTNETSSTAAR
jgi:hypothetical protein